jgi:hypothetical protein
VSILEPGEAADARRRPGPEQAQRAEGLTATGRRGCAADEGLRSIAPTVQQGHSDERPRPASTAAVPPRRMRAPHTIPALPRRSPTRAKAGQGKEAGGDGERGAPSPEADDAGSAQHHFMYKMRPRRVSLRAKARRSAEPEEHLGHKVKLGADRRPFTHRQGARSMLVRLCAS